MRPQDSIKDYIEHSHEELSNLQNWVNVLLNRLPNDFEIKLKDGAIITKSKIKSSIRASAQRLFSNIYAIEDVIISITKQLGFDLPVNVDSSDALLNEFED